MMWWQSCSALCGKGTQTRARTVTKPATNAGKCQDLSEVGVCTLSSGSLCVSPCQNDSSELFGTSVRQGAEYCTVAPVLRGSPKLLGRSLTRSNPPRCRVCSFALIEQTQDCVSNKLSDGSKVRRATQPRKITTNRPRHTSSARRAVGASPLAHHRLSWGVAGCVWACVLANAKANP